MEVLNKHQQMYRASKYFTFSELYASEGATRAGIDNTPPTNEMANLVWLANNILDKCRDFVGGPLHASCFRSAALNRITPGAAPKSFHTLGCAADINCGYYGHGNNGDLFRWMVKELDFAQLIWEFGTVDRPAWIHVTAFRPEFKMIGSLKWNEKKLTRIYSKDGETIKVPFDLSL